jgi:hypothetical protein
MTISRALSLVTILAVAGQTGQVAAQSLNLFRTEEEAQQHCPHDVVVWLDFQTRRYYVSGQRRYGQGGTAIFVCRKEASGSGYRRSLLGIR